MRWNRAYRNRPDVAARIKQNQENRKESVTELNQAYYKKKAEAIGTDSNRHKPAVCKFLKKHHEEYKDDPDALSSEFIKKLLGRHKDDCTGDDTV
jgi:hypothetical protein